MSTPIPLSPPTASLSRRGRAPCGSAAHTLLEQARQELLDAEYTSRPVDRYAHAHLSASRAAAAVLAARTPSRRRTRPISVWNLLAKVGPDFTDWAAFFAAASATRAAAEAGVSRLVSCRDANDLVRQAGEFLALAERAVSGASR